MKHVAVLTSSFNYKMSQFILGGTQTAPEHISTLFVSCPLCDESASAIELRAEYFTDLAQLEIDGYLVHTDGICNVIDKQGKEKLLNVFEPDRTALIGNKYLGLSNVRINNFDAMYEFTRQIMDRFEPRSIVFFQGPMNNPEAIERYDGYIACMKDLDKEDYTVGVYEVGFSNSSAPEFVQAYLTENKKPPDAFICSNDTVAFDVYDTLLSIDKKMAESTLITGFDNNEIDDLEKCHISSVLQPFPDMCREGLKKLSEMLAQTSEPEDLQLTAHNIIRSPNFPTEDNVEKLLFNESLSRFSIERLELARRFNHIQKMEDLLGQFSKLIYFCGIKTLIVLSKDNPSDEISLRCGCENGEVLPMDELSASPWRHTEIPENEKWCVLPMLSGDYYNGICIVRVERQDVEYVEILALQIADSINAMRLQTQAESLQEKVNEQSKFAALGTLVTGVAHELNTPVGNGVLAASEQMVIEKKLLAQIDSGKLQKSQLVDGLTDLHETSEIIFKTLTQASELIRNFKKLALLESKSIVEEVALGTYIREILGNIEFKLDIPRSFITFNADTDPTVHCNTGALHEVLHHLVENAFLHGYQGGAVTGVIAVTLSESPEGSLDLVIRDSGSGMSAQLVDEIYNPFFSTEKGTGHTGLGLNIAYNAVIHGLHGEIKCTSELKQGTTFQIRLPRNDIHNSPSNP